MRFKPPRIDVDLVELLHPAIAKGDRPHLTYYLLEATQFVMRDVFHVENGRIMDAGFRRRPGQGRVHGRVVGLHKVDWRRAADGAAHSYRALDDAYHDLYRSDGIDRNFIVAGDLVGVFDHEGIMHTVLEISPVPFAIAAAGGAPELGR